VSAPASFKGERSRKYAARATHGWRIQLSRAGADDLALCAMPADVRMRLPADDTRRGKRLWPVDASVGPSPAGERGRFLLFHHRRAHLVSGAAGPRTPVGRSMTTALCAALGAEAHSGHCGGSRWSRLDSSLARARPGCDPSLSRFNGAGTRGGSDDRHHRGRHECIGRGDGENPRSLPIVDRMKENSPSVPAQSRPSVRVQRIPHGPDNQQRHGEVCREGRRPVLRGSGPASRAGRAGRAACHRDRRTARQGSRIAARPTRLKPVLRPPTNHARKKCASAIDTLKINAEPTAIAQREYQHRERKSSRERVVATWSRIHGITRVPTSAVNAKSSSP